MKTALTAFFFKMFNSKKFDRASQIILSIAFAYFLTHVLISIIQKW